jgi:DNA-binding MarR family transcriptional regulator
MSNKDDHLEERDFVDQLDEQWQRARPDFDHTWFGIITRIQRLAVFVNSIQEQFASAHGLKYGEFLVLAALRRSAPDFALNPTELFKSLLITSGAITKRVDRLVAMGLVERRADPADRRGVLVYLTAKGRQLSDEMSGNGAQNSRYQPLRELPAEDRQELTRLLRKVLAGFERSEAIRIAGAPARRAGRRRAPQAEAEVPPAEPSIAAPPEKS